MFMDVRRKRRFEFVYNGEKCDCVRLAVHRISKTAEISVGSVRGDGPYTFYLFSALEGRAPQVSLFLYSEIYLLQKVLAEAFVKDNESTKEYFENLFLRVTPDSVFISNLRGSANNEYRNDWQEHDRRSFSI